MNDQKIRLIGIDAPESRQRCQSADGASWACGKAATRELALVLKNQPVRCEVEANDAYGRGLAVCWAGGIEVNAWMVERGWAVAFVRYDRRYLNVQRIAQYGAAGLWRGPFDMPWDWRRAQVVAAADTGERECLIKGNINRRKEQIYHLPFHRDYHRTRINEAKGERWFCTVDEAVEAGWRRAHR